MQNLYLLRHGEAESISPSDRQRRLTALGVADITAQALHLVDAVRVIDRIYHSPYVRTKQTADLVAKSLPAELHPLSALVPSGNIPAILAELVGIKGNVLLVTHLPLVAELAHHLTSRIISFQPGTLVQIIRSDPFSETANLGWVRHPH